MSTQLTPHAEVRRSETAALEHCRERVVDVGHERCFLVVFASKLGMAPRAARCDERDTGDEDDSSDCDCDALGHYRRAKSRRNSCSWGEGVGGGA